MKNIAALILAGFILSGCDAMGIGATPIKDVVAAPASFEGKEIRLHGTVTGATKIPLIDIKMYTLKDETGEITVMTQNALPTENAKITIKGTIESAAILGGQSIGLRITEKQRL